jgi:hypothetical protein
VQFAAVETFLHIRDPASVFHVGNSKTGRFWAINAITRIEGSMKWPGYNSCRSHLSHDAKEKPPEGSSGSRGLPSHFLTSSQHPLKRETTELAAKGGAWQS